MCMCVATEERLLQCHYLSTVHKSAKIYTLNSPKIDNWLYMYLYRCGLTGLILSYRIARMYGEFGKLSVTCQTIKPFILVLTINNLFANCSKREFIKLSCYIAMVF